MEPRIEVDTLLRQHGAVLKRDKKHEVWELPDGKKFTRAKTPSDVKADANSLSELKKLLRREAPANGGGVVTQPVRPPVAGLPLKTMRKVEKVLITPQQAASWLELNVKNRPLSQKVWGGYAEDMRTGRWMYNFQPIIFSNENVLIDGQHRLKACVESGVPIHCDVVFDAPPELMGTVDIGYIRTTAHMATLEGLEYSAQISAIARLLLIIDQNDGCLVSDTTKVTKPMVLQAVREHGKHLVDVVRAVEHGRKLCTIAILGAAYVLFQRRNPEKAERFFDLLLNGVNLDKTSPVRMLRERMIENRSASAKLPSRSILALMIKTWNMYCSGKTVQLLVWRKDEEFPKVQG